MRRKQYIIIYDSKLKSDPMLALINKLNTDIAQGEEIKKRKNQPIQSYSYDTIINVQGTSVKILRDNFVRQFEEFVNKGGQIDMKSLEYQVYRKLKWQKILF